MTTPIGKGFRSLNLTLRKELQLYANVRPCLRCARPCLHGAGTRGRASGRRVRQLRLYANARPRLGCARRGAA